jgi:hypothetical protein
MPDYIVIKDSANVDRNVAAKDVGGVYHQIFVPFERDRFDVYTVAANGTAVDVSLVPCSRFSMQVKGTGAAAGAWAAVLVGSLDGVNFNTTIVTHASADGDADGATKMLATPSAVKYFRSRVDSLTLGGASNIVITILGQAA